MIDSCSLSFRAENKTASLIIDLITLLACVCVCVCVCVAGLRGSLSRLQLDYVDIVFANRSDINAPMEGQTHTHTHSHTHTMIYSQVKCRSPQNSSGDLI